MRAHGKKAGLFAAFALFAYIYYFITTLPRSATEQQRVGDQEENRKRQLDRIQETLQKLSMDTN